MTIDQVAFVAPDAALGQRLMPVARRIFTETFVDRSWCKVLAGSSG
ncbi:hypothetical protein [Sphingomonas sp. MMS24-J13]